MAGDAKQTFRPPCGSIRIAGSVLCSRSVPDKRRRRCPTLFAHRSLPASLRDGSTRFVYLAGKSYEFWFSNGHRSARKFNSIEQPLKSPLIPA
jgi:hypothetical protein